MSEITPEHLRLFEAAGYLTFLPQPQRAQKVLLEQQVLRVQLELEALPGCKA